jgi:hypothetical protein
LTVALYVFGLLNLAVTYGVPGGPARVRETYRQVFTDERLPETFVDWAVWGGIIWGLLVSALFLWLLLSRRQAFLRACSPAPATPDLVV